ncbi:alpha/beta hydrolase [Roseateles sp. DC23W]|uniref:Alpha/beta hydrolase n=1 Tax=Pelomonas dachongensis TaxID=3299029 RepID=A0ABW7EFP6_9BURK
MRLRNECRYLIAALLFISWRTPSRRASAAQRVLNAWFDAEDDAAVPAILGALEDTSGSVEDRLLQMVDHVDVHAAHSQLLLDWVDSLARPFENERVQELFSKTMFALVFDPLQKAMDEPTNFGALDGTEAEEADWKFADPVGRYVETLEIHGPPSDQAMLACKEYRSVVVYFGTNRADGNSGDHRAKHFSGEDGEELRFGKAVVTLPRDRREGDLDRPWSFIVRFDEDKRVHVVVDEVSLLGKDDWIEQAADGAAGQPAFLFVHGYNVTFDEAVRRTAQLAYDLKLTALPLCYSWPSAGRVLSYAKDEVSVQNAALHLQSFMRVVMEELKLTQLHIVAHSMGNRAVLEVLRRLSESGASVAPLDQVVLAAPDVHTGTFRQLGTHFTKFNQVTMYASRRDWAILASKVFHQGPRASDGAPPLVLPPMETVDVTNVSQAIFDLGHGYISSATKVFRDLYEILKHGTPAAERPSVQRADRGAHYELR